MFWFHRSTKLFQSQISSVKSSCSLYQHCERSKGSCCCWRNNATCEYKILLLLLLSLLILLFALIWQTSVTLVKAVQILLWHNLFTIHLLHTELWNWTTGYILSPGFLDTFLLIRLIDLVSKLNVVQIHKTNSHPWNKTVYSKRVWIRYSIELANLVYNNFVWYFCKDFSCTRIFLLQGKSNLILCHYFLDVRFQRSVIRLCWAS